MRNSEKLLTKIQKILLIEVDILLIIENKFIINIELFEFLILKKSFPYYTNYRKNENLLKINWQKLLIYILIHNLTSNFSNFFHIYLFLFQI